MPEYKYKGYTIRQVERPIPICPRRMLWDIFDGETLFKRSFATIDIAKHYIDIYGRKEDDGRK